MRKGIVGHIRRRIMNMDIFMDKLSQKTTAQEMIKANTAADVEELNSLRNQVAEYNECLARLGQLLDEGERKIASVRAQDGEAFNRLMEDNAGQIRKLQQDVGDLAKMQKSLTERVDSMEQTLAKGMERMTAKQEELLGRQDETLEERLEDKLNGIGEDVHKECVKVYRNVQAVVVAENEKQDKALEEAVDDMKGVRSKVSAVLGISIAALVFSLIGAGLQLLSVFHISLF